MTATLLINVYSVFNSKKPLGVKGECVTVISNHGSVLIVEGTTKFSVNENEVKKHN